MITATIVGFWLQAERWRGLRPELVRTFNFPPTFDSLLIKSKLAFIIAKCIAV